MNFWQLWDRHPIAVSVTLIIVAVCLIDIAGNLSRWRWK